MSPHDDEQEGECEAWRQRVFTTTQSIHIGSSNHHRPPLTSTSWPAEHNWRMSRRSFSSHLARLSEIITRAEDQHSLMEKMIQSVLLDCEKKKSDKSASEVLTRQKGTLVAIGRIFKELQVIFSEVDRLKHELAEAISLLQEQLQNISSELETKDRSCQRCYRSLMEIAKCSAILDQLQNSPELYIRCLLEVYRRRRLSRAWSCLSEQYTRRLVDFQRSEARRCESLAQALKDNLLGDVFRPLHLRLRGARQHSRLSLISTSSKRLTDQSKCLSTSQINFQAPSTAFRLPSNRSVMGAPPEVVHPCPITCAEATVATTAEKSGEAASLPIITEADIRKMANQVPADLEKMITETLVEVDAEASQVDLVAECFFDEGGVDFTAKLHTRCLKHQRLGRSRLASSPGALVTLLHTAASVDATTTMEGDRLACIAEQSVFLNVQKKD